MFRKRGSKTMRRVKISQLNSWNSIIVPKWQFQTKCSRISRRERHNSIVVHRILRLRTVLVQKIWIEKRRAMKSLVGPSSIHQVVKVTLIQVKPQSLIQTDHSISPTNSTRQLPQQEIWRKYRKVEIKVTWGLAHKSKLPTIRCSLRSQASCKANPTQSESKDQNRKVHKWLYKRWWIWLATLLLQSIKKQRANTNSVSLRCRTITTRLRGLAQWIFMDSNQWGTW